MNTFRKTCAIARAFVLSVGSGLARSAFAVDENAVTDTPQNDVSHTFDTVIVTGTSSKERTAGSSLQPIDIISSEALQQTGTTTLAEALSRLVPSLNFPQPVTISGSETVKPVTLRGLSPDQVLVLIDGKRQHAGAMLNNGGAIGRGSNPVDLNAIPISAIERVEVLRDGSSARYGSDAIGGVVNVILRKGAQGGNLDAGFGGYTQGDGLHRQLSGSAGLSLGDKGWLRASVDFQDNGYSNDAGPDLSSNAIGTAAYGQRTARLGDPAVRSSKFGLNGEYDFSDAVQLYGFTLVRRDHDETALVYREPRASNNVLSIYPNGYLPLAHPAIEDLSAVLGLKGQFGDGWRYDLSLNHGYNQYHSTYDAINADYYRAFGTTPYHYVGSTYRYTQDVVDLDISREFAPSWLASPLTLAFGVEYQRQIDQISPGDIYSQYGAGGSISGDSYGEWDRRDLAEYVNVEANLTERFSSAFALRHENYSDFGGNTSGSLSSRFDFTPQVALRGTLATAFRAPTLVQEHYAQITSQYVDAVPTEVGTFPVDSQVASLLGAKPLKAETSRSASLGWVLNPLDAWYLTADAYLIKIMNRINLSSNLVLTGNQAAIDYLAANGVTANYQQVRFFTNAVDTLTRGIEVVNQYGWRFDNGQKLDTVLSWAYNENTVTDVHAAPAILSELGIAGTLVERRERYGMLGDSNPRTKLDLGLDYGYDAHWSASANINRYGWYKTYSNSGAQYDQWFGPRWTLDLSIKYAIDGWNFSVGSNNVTDVRPGRVDAINNTGGSYVYSLYSPLNWSGRYVYTRAGYSWK